MTTRRVALCATLALALVCAQTFPQPQPSSSARGSAAAWPPRRANLLPLRLALEWPRAGDCVAAGAARAVLADILLLNEGDPGYDASAAGRSGSSVDTQEALVGAELCVVVDGGNEPDGRDDGMHTDCETLSNMQPPRLPALEPGCHSARLELHGTPRAGRHDAVFTEDEGRTLLASSDEVPFQVASFLRCESNAPRCPTNESHGFTRLARREELSEMPRPYDGLHIPPTGVGSDYYPRRHLSQDNDFSSAVKDGFSFNGGADPRVRLMSGSPEHGDVVFSRELLIEVSREIIGRGDTISVAGLLRRPRPSVAAPARLCLHLLILGPATVTPDAVIVTDVNIAVPPAAGALVSGALSWLRNASFELCLAEGPSEAGGEEPGPTTLEASISLGIGGPSTTSASAVIRASLEQDQHVDVVRVAFPAELFSRRGWGLGEDRSIDGVSDGVADGDHSVLPLLAGLVVAYQAWLLPTGSSVEWAAGLPTPPRQVVLAPHVRFDWQKNVNRSKGCANDAYSYTAGTTTNNNDDDKDEDEDCLLGGAVLSAVALARDSRILSTQPLPVLVLCHWSEDLDDWVRTQPFHVVVYEKKPPKNSFAVSGLHGVPVNVAGEATAFLKFIVDYYDHLPARMVKKKKKGQNHCAA